MLVYLNGHEKKLSEPLTLAEFLVQQHVSTTHCAIAINHQFVPKSTYSRVRLNANDKIECLTPMQGG